MLVVFAARSDCVGGGLVLSSLAELASPPLAAAALFSAVQA